MPEAIAGVLIGTCGRLVHTFEGQMLDGDNPCHFRQSSSHAVSSGPSLP